METQKLKIGIVLISIFAIASVILSGSNNLNFLNFGKPEISYVIEGCEDKVEIKGTRELVKDAEPIIYTEGDMIILEYDFEYYCCADLDFNFEVSGNVITIKGINEGNICKCICKYKVKSNISSLAEGNYTLDLYLESANGESVLVDESEINVEGSGGGGGGGSGEESIFKSKDVYETYCESRGGIVRLGETQKNCVFPDGSICEINSFYEGTCEIGENYPEFCGYSIEGYCESDQDCIRSGCSSEVCQSINQKKQNTLCVWKECYNPKRYSIECKCKNNKCQWV
jgi:eight-cysteine-cluster-containing protein